MLCCDRAGEWLERSNGGIIAPAAIAGACVCACRCPLTFAFAPASCCSVPDRALLSSACHCPVTALATSFCLSSSLAISALFFSSSARFFALHHHDGHHSQRRRRSNHRAASAPALLRRDPSRSSFSFRLCRAVCDPLQLLFDRSPRVPQATPLSVRRTTSLAGP